VGNPKERCGEGKTVRRNEKNRLEDQGKKGTSRAFMTPSLGRNRKGYEGNENCKKKKRKAELGGQARKSNGERATWSIKLLSNQGRKAARGHLTVCVKMPSSGVIDEERITKSEAVLRH